MEIKKSISEEFSPGVFEECETVDKTPALNYRI
jgi:hypothetical protein